MHDERPPRRGGRVRLAKVAAQGQRMAPAIILNDSNREAFSLQFRPKGILVADRGDSAEQVSQAAPPEANLLWHRPMFRNQIGKPAVYVVSPLDVILIRRISQSRE